MKVTTANEAQSLRFSPQCMQGDCRAYSSHPLPLRLVVPLSWAAPVDSIGADRSQVLTEVQLRRPMLGEHWAAYAVTPRHKVSDRIVLHGCCSCG